MVKRRRLIEKIREAGYAYRGETKRTQLYRRPGVTHRLAVPMGSLLEDVQVRSMLRQAGYSDAEIHEFIEDCGKDLA